jgi:hypothetical protein
MLHVRDLFGGPGAMGALGINKSTPLDREPECRRDASVGSRGVKGAEA